MFKGFKKFILRGNVIDLAVGVVIGAAFNNVVTALVKDLLTPLISAVAKVSSFSDVTFTVRGAEFPIGDFLSSIISFLLVAIAVYFFVVLPINKLLSKMQTDEPTPEPDTKKCPECLSDIPLEATRCAHCGVAVVK